MRFFRLFSILTLVVGLITLFQAFQLYLFPTIIIEWSTASELDVAGFNILRAEQIEGPYLQINSGLIPPSVDSLQGGDYTYQDRHVTGKKTYFYQLQEVDISGISSLHGPIEASATREGSLEFVLGAALIAGSIWMLRNKRPA